MATLQDFENILMQTLSPDNAIRKHAEELFEQAKQIPDQIITYLTQLLRQSERPDVRALCAVMLRRLLATNISQSMWPRLSPALQHGVKEELLRSIEQEQTPHVRHKVCDTISELAALIVETGGWAELLPKLLEYAKSPQWALRESSLLMFSNLAHYLSDMLKPHFQTLLQMFQQGLTDQESIKVRIAGLAATTNFLVVLDKEQRDQFRPLVPIMLETIRAALVAKEEDSTRSSLEILIGLAESEPTFLRQHMQQVVTAMIQIAQTADLDDSIRQSAMEFLMTLAENAPSMARKMQTFVQLVFPVALGFMLEREDDPSWNEDEGTDDEEENCSVGEQALDRMAIAIGGKSVLPVAFALIPQFLANADWRYRHAALMAISTIGEGCQKTMIQQLGAVLQMVLQHFNDPHPRVRYAACNAIGQMSTDFGPQLQDNFHESVLAGLMHLMDDQGNPRVQAHAAAAVINFTEKCDKEILKLYLDGLLSKLLQLLQCNRKMVQEQAITAIASVADCASEHFIRFYDTFMPLLKQILYHANSKEYRMLRGKAMECISLIGMAVGKEKFFGDAKEVMDFMVQAQSVQYESDDPQIGYMLQAWARICSSIGDAFIPYLTVVMPPLMRSASIKPDVQISNADDEENARQEGWDTMTMGDKVVAIKTSALDEKATACNLLCCYIAELGAGFYPHIEETARLLVPLVKFYINDEVRDAAVSSLADMLRCVKEEHERKGIPDGGKMKQLLDYILSVLVPALTEEPELDILIDMCEALHKCLQTAGEKCLDGTQMQAIVTAITKLVHESEERRSKRLKRHKDEDFDEEEGEELAAANSREEDLFGQIGECVGQLVKTHHQYFLPLFDQFAQNLSIFLQPGRSDNDFVTVLCIFDDVIEFAAPDSVKYIPAMLPIYIACLQHKAATVRQAAVYGLGLCANLGGEIFTPYVQQALTTLSQLITYSEARAESNVMVTENAVSALGQLCLKHPQGYDVGAAWQLWVLNLPVLKDEEEAPKVCSMLCSLVESSHPHVLGSNNAHVPHIVQCFARWLAARTDDDTPKDVIDMQLKSRVVALLKHMRVAFPAEIMQAAWQQLPDDLQRTLQTFGAV